MNGQPAYSPPGDDSTLNSSNNLDSSNSNTQKVNSNTPPTWTPAELASLQEAHFSGPPPAYEASGVPRYERYPRPTPGGGRRTSQANQSSHTGANGTYSSTTATANGQQGHLPQVLAALRRRRRMNILLLALFLAAVLVGFAALAHRCAGETGKCFG